MFKKILVATMLSAMAVPALAHADKPCEARIERAVVKVDARRTGWTQTGIELSRGDYLMVFPDGLVNLTGKKGTENLREAESKRKNGSLKIRIGRRWETFTGRSFALRARGATGAVKLWIKDSNHTDNSGAYEVELVKVSSVAAPPPGATQCIEISGNKKISTADKTRAKFDVTETGAETSLGPREVMRAVHSRYLDGLKRCHGKLLEDRPRAGGKTVIRFVVGKRGDVTHAIARGFNRQLDICLKGQVRGWRFDPPTGPHGTRMEAAFQMPLVVQPKR